MSRGGVGLPLLICQTVRKDASSVPWHLPCYFLRSCYSDLNSNNIWSLTLQNSTHTDTAGDKITSAIHWGRSLVFLMTNETPVVPPVLSASCWWSLGSGFSLNAIGHTFRRLQETAIVKIRACSYLTKRLRSNNPKASTTPNKFLAKA